MPRASEPGFKIGAEDDNASGAGAGGAGAGVGGGAGAGGGGVTVAGGLKAGACTRSQFSSA